VTHFLFGFVAVLAATAPAVAQAPGAGTTGGGGSVGRGAGVAHYGKWATAATAVTLTVLGAREHRRSADQWDHLLAICAGDHADCVLSPDGRYENPAAETYYRASMRYDRRARVRLLGGQAALLVTVGLFLLDMRHGKEGPKNIPFAPLEVTVDERRGGARVGVRLAFRGPQGHH
jgi:hypothetical protein